MQKIIFWSLEPGQVSFQEPDFMAWRNVKCLITGNGRLFPHLGPTEFSDMVECEKDLWVAGKMSWYQQRDCQSLVMEFSDGKLKQKGFFTV
jgi:hypothetical protein